MWDSTEKRPADKRKREGRGDPSDLEAYKVRRALLYKAMVPVMAVKKRGGEQRELYGVLLFSMSIRF